MKSTQTAMYLLGAVVIAAIIGIASYFLLISPELSKASTARDDTEIAQQNNALLEQKIAAMKVKEQEVPQWRDTIALISLDLPPRPEESAFTRIVTTSLNGYKLPLVTLSFAKPALVEPPTPAVAAPTPSVEPSPGATPAPSASPTATPAATDTTTGTATDVATFSGLVGIPVTVTTEGDPAKVLAFLKFMQSQNDRFFTVTSFDITTAAKSEATPGRPALTEGQWIVNITGMVFSLIDPTASFPPDEAGPIAPPTGTIPNPFIPLVASP